MLVLRAVAACRPRLLATEQAGLTCGHTGLPFRDGVRPKARTNLVAAAEHALGMGGARLETLHPAVLMGQLNAVDFMRVLDAGDFLGMGVVIARPAGDTVAIMRMTVAVAMTAPISEGCARGDARNNSCGGNNF